MQYNRRHGNYGEWKEYFLVLHRIPRDVGAQVAARAFQLLRKTRWRLHLLQLLDIMASWDEAGWQDSQYRWEGHTAQHQSQILSPSHIIASPSRWETRACLASCWGVAEEPVWAPLKESERIRGEAHVNSSREEWRRKVWRARSTDALRDLQELRGKIIFYWLLEAWDRGHVEKLRNL